MLVGHTDGNNLQQDETKSVVEIFQPHSEDSSLSNIQNWQGMVAHACNPRYSRCRDWEDHGARPSQEES
jgi:hypothetical protein